MKLHLSQSNTPIAAAALMCSVVLAGNVDRHEFEWRPAREPFGPASRFQTVQSAVRAVEKASWQKVAARRLAEVAVLEDGWDGPASSRVTPEALTIAARVLEVAFRSVAHPAVPSVAPAGDGSLQMEWRLNDSRFALEVEADGTVSAWALDRRSGAEQERSGSEALELFFSWADRLTADKYTAA